MSQKPYLRASPGSGLMEEDADCLLLSHLGPQPILFKCPHLRGTHVPGKGAQGPHPPSAGLVGVGAFEFTAGTR